MVGDGIEIFRGFVRCFDIAEFLWGDGIAVDGERVCETCFARETGEICDVARIEFEFVSENGFACEVDEIVGFDPAGDGIVVVAGDGDAAERAYGGDGFSRGRSVSDDVAEADEFGDAEFFRIGDGAFERFSVRMHV